MSKICIKCGAVLDDDALFCDDCGEKQGVRKTEQEMKDNVVEVDEVEIEKKLVASVPIGNDESAKSKTETISPPYRESETKSPLKQSKIGIAALVMGVIAIVSLGSLIVFDILGIIFGIAGMKKKDSKMGFAKAGLILSVVATIIILIVMAAAILFGW